MSTLVKIGIALALMVGAWFAWEAHEQAVFDRGYQAAMAKRDAQDVKHLAEDIALALAKERQFAAQLAAAEAQRLQEKADHETEKADAVRIARAGNSGMRCPKPPVRADAAPGSPGAVAGPGEAQDDRLVPEAAGDILDIVADRAQDVRDYNDLADQYDELVLFCNGKSSKPPATRPANPKATNDPT